LDLEASLELKLVADTNMAPSGVCRV
jgi:hypothetical protein